MSCFVSFRFLSPRNTTPTIYTFKDSSTKVRIGSSSIYSLKYKCWFLQSTSFYVKIIADTSNQSRVVISGLIVVTACCGGSSSPDLPMPTMN